MFPIIKLFRSLYCDLLFNLLTDLELSFFYASVSRFVALLACLFSYFEFFIYNNILKYEFAELMYNILKF